MQTYFIFILTLFYCFIVFVFIKSPQLKMAEMRWAAINIIITRIL